MSDKHENKNWEFRKAKPLEDGTFARLYRNRQTPSIFKRVAKRNGTQSHQWEAVFYTNSQLKDRFGKLTWVGTQKELEMLAQVVASQEEIYKQLEANGTTWTEEAYA